jgi:hypothetical protein
MTQDAKEIEKKFADITIEFRDRQKDTLIYQDIIGYQVGGGVVGITNRDGVTKVHPLDLIEEITHVVYEA